MAKYFKDKNIIRVAPDHATEILDNLPCNIYSLQFNPLQGFYLEEVEAFNLPDKIYGSVEKDAVKILKTYAHRSNVNTGALLSGEKGSGKTMSARLLSKLCADMDIPTIIINTDFEQDFCKFICDINQKCLVLFDEFEKTFLKDESQNKLLTLFDGTYSSNKLILLTANNLYKVSEFFLNRPGRIYYHIKYDTVEEEFIREYCAENLNNISYVESIVNLSKIINKFTFDMLQAIVCDCNLHKQSPKEVYEMLNIDCSNEPSVMYKFTVINTLLDRKYTGTTCTQILGTQSAYLHHTSESKEIYEDSDNEQEYVDLSQNNFVSANNGVFNFKDRDCIIQVEKADVKKIVFDF